MKSKISRILGVGLTIAVLASMLVVATPVSAGNLSWTAGSPLNQPKTVSGVAVVDFAVAANGTTAYAAASDSTIHKTTDGGKTWAKQSTYAGGLAKKIAVPRDVADGSLVFAVAGTTVWVSENGGTTWGSMASVVDGTSTASVLNSIDVAPSVQGGRTIVVGGTSTLGGAGVWYYTVGGGITGPGNMWIDAGSNAGWTVGSFTSTGSALAVKVSPNYIADRSIVVVTASAGGSVLLQVASIASKKWNQDVFGSAPGPFGTGATVQAGAAGVGAVGAEIALPGTFILGDSTSTITYVAVADNGTASGGVYRQLNGGVATNLLAAGVDAHSVALNGAGDKLVAGIHANNSVYRVSSPQTAVAGAGVPASKAPSYTGTSMVTVDYFGASVGAATQGGAESAFALSTDDGKSFNDVAFINTIAAVKDLAVKADGTVIYLVTENAGVASLWKKTTAWERVFKRPVIGSGFIVRNALDNFDVVFFAEKGGTAIWVSNDGGQASWSGKSSFQTIGDLAAESVSVIYVLSNGSVSKAVDGGFLFDNPLKSTGAGANGSMTLVAKDNLLVAGDTGTAYSTDGGNTWVSTGQAFTGGADVAVADKLSSGGVITAVGGAAGTDVKTFTIGTSTAFSSNAATLGAAGNSIALNGGMTYVMTTGAMARSKITASAWASVSTGAATLMDMVPGTGGILWAINTADNSIWSYTEVFAAAGPAMTLPAANAVIAINAETGFANNVVFQWTAIPSSPPSGVAYTLQLALDSGFTQVVYTNASVTGVLSIVGQSQVAPNLFPFQADTTYYARVRADAPVDSPWSATRTFKIDTLAPLKLQAPGSGAASISVSPTFVWSPVAGATTYELVVSDDPTFAIITFSRTTNQPVFASDEQLAYNTVYYWRVRASAPATAVTPFATGIFTTEARPVPPTTPPPPVTVTQTSVTVTVPPAETVEIIPPWMLWIIIGIGAILVIALIVLIARTRRVG